MIQSFPKLKKSKQHKYSCLQIEKLQKLSIYLFLFFSNLKKAQNMDLIFCNLQKLKKHESYFLQATKSKHYEFDFFQIKKPEKAWI